MGKAKDFWRSLRARLSTSFKARDESTKSRQSSVFSTFPQTPTDPRSVSTTGTQATSYNEAQTTSTPPSITFVDRIDPEKTALTGSLVDIGPRKDMVNQCRVELDARTTLEVNITILRFMQRLPLDELHMVGQGLKLPSFSTNGDTVGGDGGRFPRSVALGSSARSRTVSSTSTTGDSSSSFAYFPARRIEQGRTERHYGHDRYAIQEELSLCSSVIDMDPHADARTLSLTSEDDSIWSVSRCSSQRVERDLRQPNRDGKMHLSDGSADPVNRNRVLMSHNNGDSLDPKASDRNRPPRPHSSDRTPGTQQTPAEVDDSAVCAGQSDTWETAPMERAPSFTERSTDSCDLFLESIGLPLPTDGHPRRSDDVLDDLPDWSDVEDDPEYNQFEERPYPWSDTNSSQSSRNSIRTADASSPTFHMPSVFVNVNGDAADSADVMP